MFPYRALSFCGRGIVAALSVSGAVALGADVTSITRARAAMPGLMAPAITSASQQALHPLNPIRLSDTADPGVVRFDGRWYVCHTSSGASYKKIGRYPIVVSDDLTSWTTVGTILSAGDLPAWCSESHNWWAPEVHWVGDKFVAYYTARENGTGKFAIGAAISRGPAGPFKPLDKPIKKVDAVGLIDVSWFSDPVSGKPYLLWKEDRNDLQPQEPTPLMMQEMARDGIHLVGEAREILRNDLPWEGVLVEAPSLVYRDGWYYLFYSANGFASDDYAVGVARSRDVWGPYVKKAQPILTDDEDFSGPGHQFVIQDENGVWHIFYHARLKKLGSGSRFLMHDVVEFGADGWPRINDGHPGAVRPDAVEKVKELRRRSKRD